MKLKLQNATILSDQPLFQAVQKENFKVIFLCSASFEVTAFFLCREKSRTVPSNVALAEL